MHLTPKQYQTQAKPLTNCDYRPAILQKKTNHKYFQL